MEHPTHPEVLVDGQWLSDHLDDPNVRVVDIELDPARYDSGHLPGAVHWPALTTLLGPDFRTNFDADAVGLLLGRSGITNETIVVVCSDHRALGPWGFWFLQMIGHERVLVLDGGMEKWRSEGRPLSADAPVVEAVEYRSKLQDHPRRAPSRTCWLRSMAVSRCSWTCAHPRSGAERSSLLRHLRPVNAAATFPEPCISITNTH